MLATPPSRLIRNLANTFVAAILLASGAKAQVKNAQPPANPLAAAFTNPPAQARPHTWWHWMNGNITRAGITADLTAMKQVGVGGAQIFNVSESIPPGPILFMSPEWRSLVKHAATEADRLGIELCMHNCAGWSSSGGPWITPENAMQMVVVSETKAAGPQKYSAALPQPETRNGYYRDIAVLAFLTPKDDAKRVPDFRAKAGYDSKYGQQPSLDAYPTDAVIDRETIIILTSKLSDTGTLSWDMPEGQWTIQRFGYTPTGAVNAPSPDSGRGLEVDKFSREAFDTHWAGMMGPILKDLGPLAGKTLNNCLIDSYEVGAQNWTKNFAAEFKARRGYDILTYLPAMTGRVVDSGEVTERFLWDLRRTIGDLFADNYYSYFAEVCRKNGLKASIEPYDGPFECLLAGRDADIPMGEFWVGGGETNSVKLAASVGHTYGQPIIGAEAFTAEPGVGRWQNHPGSLKAIGDLMYCAGINRYIIHRYAHQPWLDKLPGMTMGQWGTHFERTTTWWGQGAAWLGYLARCQSLLQQGRFAADVCFFAGEASPNGAPHVPELKALGYDYDSINADVLTRRITVRDGRLVLPNGTSYGVLVLPDTPFMTPTFAARIRDLVEQGAVIIGPRPDRSPTLADMGKGDEQVKSIAAAVWGDCDGKTVKSHAFGKGRVHCGRTTQEVLAELKVQPDCEFTASGGKPKMAWIHRVCDGADVYFVSNQKPRVDEVVCSFRITGKLPELWHADTGTMEVAPIWSEENGRTLVTLRFEPTESVFVVFAKPAGTADHLTKLSSRAAADAPPANPIIQIESAVYEAIDGAGKVDVTAKVADMVKTGETTIPATNSLFGDPIFNHVKRLVVKYTLNGKKELRSCDENGAIELAEPGPVGAPASWRVAVGAGGDVGLVAFASGVGVYEFTTAMAKKGTVEIKNVPAPLDITGPWEVYFPPNLGAPEMIILDKLAWLTEHSDPGVKYFSGTATYLISFDVPSDLIRENRILELNLGQVREIAQVSINGHDTPVIWKPPFSIDLTGQVKPGKNTITIRITNLWVNRLIGDEQLPDDCEWNGKPIKAWPNWMVEGTPRPSQRLTFTTWKHFTKDSRLPDSGLLGPVMIRVGDRVSLGLFSAGLNAEPKAQAKPGLPLPARKGLAMSESQKIERMLIHLKQSDATFIRNDVDYDGQKASAHLRSKWTSEKDRIKTARDFIDGLASKSSSSDKPYQIRKQDGSVVNSADWFNELLATIESGG